MCLLIWQPFSLIPHNAVQFINSPVPNGAILILLPDAIKTGRLLISFRRARSLLWRSLFLFETRARLFVSLSLIWARSVSAKHSTVYAWWDDRFISSFSITNNTTLLASRLRVLFETCLYHTVCVFVFPFFFFLSFWRKFRERLCMQTIEGLGDSRARIILAYLDRERDLYP